MLIYSRVGPFASSSNKFLIEPDVATQENLPVNCANKNWTNNPDDAFKVFRNKQATLGTIGLPDGSIDEEIITISSYISLPNETKSSSDSISAVDFNPNGSASASIEYRFCYQATHSFQVRVTGSSSGVTAGGGVTEFGLPDPETGIIPQTSGDLLSTSYTETLPGTFFSSVRFSISASAGSLPTVNLSIEILAD